MDYVTELRKKVGHRPLILPGAVVIVLTSENEVLLQQREDGSWGLPGGLMELGESMEDTARREVTEETGLIIGELTLQGIYSGSEYYFKLSNKDELYSVTAVFQTTHFAGELRPDLNESLDLQFFKKEFLPSGLTKEYKVYLSSFIEKNFEVPKK
ncbi:ADP-ribose pyrophosphatase YjhB (NUDIX family) [Planomicrobium soli]|uniref:ADP-ribose pyrophosphatase YjhB (NUDIX family) n=1 Tax=Planomicrobium soli TaxID=1176648 RepID=A0A2P8H6D6_9BACL|nr:NUDIX hydrolase [Planomicrobium soli]PSL41776.1 ADP-ribose pyrophosphatase YjhB (NUDIX family) [Planomicrobium soli]